MGVCSCMCLCVGFCLSFFACWITSDDHILSLHCFRCAAVAHRSMSSIFSCVCSTHYCNPPPPPDPKRKKRKNKPDLVVCTHCFFKLPFLSKNKKVVKCNIDVHKLIKYYVSYFLFFSPSSPQHNIKIHRI